MPDTFRGPVTDRAARDRALFDRVASGLEGKDLHPTSSVARRQRLEATLSPLQLPASPIVLEAGCGSGFGAHYLGSRCGTYLGLDHSHELVERAQRRHGASNIHFRVADLGRTVETYSDLAPSGFDVIFMVGVLHHLEDPLGALAWLAARLAPGGWIAINEPQPANRLIGAARRLRKRLDRSYSDEQDELSWSALEGLLQGVGLVDVRIRAQGVFSTPFAEVPMGPVFITRPLARLACRLDLALEARWPEILARFSWNLVATGRRPAPPDSFSPHETLLH